MPTVASILLRALLITVTPRTAALLNRLLFELLEDMAKKTETDLDDKLYALMKRFLIEEEQSKKAD